MKSALCHDRPGWDQGRGSCSSTRPSGSRPRMLLEASTEASTEATAEASGSALATATRDAIAAEIDRSSAGERQRPRLRVHRSNIFVDARTDDHEHPNEAIHEAVILPELAAAWVNPTDQHAVEKLRSNFCRLLFDFAMRSAMPRPFAFPVFVVLADYILGQWPPRNSKVSRTNVARSSKGFDLSSVAGSALEGSCCSEAWAPGSQSPRSSWLSSWGRIRRLARLLRRAAVRELRSSPQRQRGQRPCSPRLPRYRIKVGSPGSSPGIRRGGRGAGQRMPVHLNISTLPVR